MIKILHYIMKFFKNYESNIAHQKKFSEACDYIINLSIPEQIKLFNLNQSKYIIVYNNDILKYDFLSDLNNDFFSTYKSVEIKDSYIKFSTNQIKNIKEQNIEYTFIGNESGQMLVTLKNNNSIIYHEDVYIIEELYNDKNINDNIYSFLLLDIINSKILELCYSNNTNLKKINLENVLEFFYINKL